MGEGKKRKRWGEIKKGRMKREKKGGKRIKMGEIKKGRGKEKGEMRKGECKK